MTCVATNTSTLTSATKPSAGAYTTLTGYFTDLNGPGLRTLTFPPSVPGVLGTVLAALSAPSSFTGPYTTITGHYVGTGA